MRTFIRWQGNKSNHLKKILPYVPDELKSGTFKGTYIEPFIGSGAMFLRLEPKKWIINDLNKDLINIWKSVKNNNDDIITQFKEFGKKFKQKLQSAKITFCKKQVQQIEKLPYDIERAALFMLMKFCVYMGNIVVNNKFVFNGLDLNIASKNIYTFLSKKYYILLNDISNFLNKSNGKIYNKDYKDVLKKAKKGDFVFLDPPYFENKNYTFNYNKNEIIDQSFLDELKLEVKQLDKKGVKWIMTNADTKEVRKSFSDFQIKKFQVFRRSSNEYKTELIILSNNL